MYSVHRHRILIFNVYDSASTDASSPA